jgi:hypothetical protein
MINTLRLHKIFIQEKQVSKHEDRHADYDTLKKKSNLMLAQTATQQKLSKNTRTKKNTARCQL